MMKEEKQAIASSQRKRRRRNKKLVIAPSSLPNEIVEEIFLRLPVKTLIRHMSLSKQWRLTIESLSFQERQVKIAERSHVDHHKLMFISQKLKGKHNTEIGFQTICQESGSRLYSFPPLDFPGRCHIYHSDSCNGLFCIYSLNSNSIYVVNPATQWFRQLPPSRFQILTDKRGVIEKCFLAFVKAADYKLVLLYKSDRHNSDASSPDEGVNNCEVFDFRANAWRYLTCTLSYKISHGQIPAFADGSLYWFTRQYKAEVKVVAFDIHTEIFRLLPKIHPVIASSDPNHIHMCTLDSRLCMSTTRNEKEKEIWRMKSSEDTWEKIYTIDLLSCSSLDLIYDMFSLRPVAICKKKKKKILLLHRESNNLVIYDPQRKTLRLFVKDSPFFHHLDPQRYVPYFQSLISHI